MSILIIGGTGLLGREVLKQAVKQRYNVKCLLRNSQRSYWCLKQWGVSFLYGDLAYPSTLPEAISPKAFLDYKSLKDRSSKTLLSDEISFQFEKSLIQAEIGYKQKMTDTINTIIDCATLKTTIKSDNVNLLEIVDWKGKLALLITCSIIQLKKLIFFSILDPHHESHTHQSSKPSLKSLKYLMEDLIQASNLNYTIFKLSGFFEKRIKDLTLETLTDKKFRHPFSLSINEGSSYQYTSTLCKKEVGYLVINSLTNPAYDRKLVELEEGLNLRATSTIINNLSYRAVHLSNRCVWFLTSMLYKNSVFQNLKKFSSFWRQASCVPSERDFFDKTNITTESDLNFFFQMPFSTEFEFHELECSHSSSSNLYFQNKVLLEENFTNFFHKTSFEFERIFLTAMLKK
jgi:hypothetical protein